MKDVAFTIVAKNYIGLAKILKKSFLYYNDKIDFKIFVVDELLENESDEDVLVAKNTLSISDILWNEMSFKYDLTEFCTSIKPICFKYLFFNNYQRVYYFDPDILFFNSIDLLSLALDKKDICLTPHLSLFDTIYNGDILEKNILGSGVFNLGFCGMRNSPVSLNVLNWWEDRLKTMSFSEPLEFLFTDQKWMDFLPCFLDESQLHIERNLGMNVAPWNFSEREVYIENDVYKVRPRNVSSIIYAESDLIFVHYSGYNYVGLLEGKCEQKNIEKMKEYEDVSLLLNIYQQYILDNRDPFIKNINMSYSYNYFFDGICILKLHRRIYNAWIKKGYHENPFDTKSKFYNELRRRKLLIRDNRIDKMKASNINNLYEKERKAEKLLLLFQKIVGVKYYILLIRFFRYYANFEKHFFLVKR